MSKPGDIRLDYLGIGNILSAKQVRVPKYQRSYAWEESHITDYLIDIQAAMADGETEYFLGSIVATTDDDGATEVVDGQQRLATTTMLIAAIRDWYFDQNDLESAIELEREFLLKKDRRTKELIPQLTLNDTDHGYFLDRVLAKPGSDERENVQAEARSHRRINRAAKQARVHIREITSKTNAPEDRLNDLVDYLQKCVKVIWLTAASDSNAFVIFETLNDRGLELATSDLLKNYLFSLAGDRIGEVQRHWLSMAATLERVADENIVTEFIRHYWSSHHGATRRQVLYSAIKKKTRTKAAALALAKDLDRASGIYVSMTSLDTDAWNRFGPTARGHMSTINGLGMVQIRPLVLAVLDRGMTVTEARKTLKSMVSWGVRFLIVGGLGGGTLERHYSDAAQLVRAGKTKTAKTVSSALSKVLPRDKAFEEAFATARVSKANLARYYLQALELKKTGGSQPELIPNPNPDDVNLEHVLPKKLGSAWKTAFASDGHAVYHRRIGNLALLKQSENSGSGQAGFSTKKPIYRKSAFELTRAIGNKSKWTPAEIESRQKELAALAVKTWPL